MANKFKLVGSSPGYRPAGPVQRNAGQVTLEFLSWSCYPQPLNKKTEIINRIGSNETIIQVLFESSVPTPCTAVIIEKGSFVQGDFKDALTKIQNAQTNIHALVGIDCTLTDSINTIEYSNLVIVDLVTKIKKVGEGWMLVCEFNQFLRKKAI